MEFQKQIDEKIKNLNFEALSELFENNGLDVQDYVDEEAYGSINVDKLLKIGYYLDGVGASRTYGQGSYRLFKQVDQKKYRIDLSNVSKEEI